MLCHGAGCALCSRVKQKGGKCLWQSFPSELWEFLCGPSTRRVPIEARGSSLLLLICSKIMPVLKIKVKTTKKGTKALC